MSLWGNLMKRWGLRPDGNETVTVGVPEADKTRYEEDSAEMRLRLRLLEDTVRLQERKRRARGEG